MKRIVIPKSRIRELLDALTAAYRVVAPVKENGVLEFREILSAAQVQLTDEITYKSPKEFFFPRTEKFLSFNQNGDVIEESKPQKTVIFGVRPCDLEALKVMTAVFTGGKFTDTIFAGHLENAAIIGLGCVGEKPGCFCRERNIDKNSSFECDMFLINKGDHYLADILTSKGESIINEFLPDTQEDAKAACTAEEVNTAKEVCTAEEVNTAKAACTAEEACTAKEACTAVATNTAPVAEDVREILQLDIDENILFNSVDWGSISETCLACGTCTYICPTCHCFGFRDVVEKGVTSRYRCWDSCMYPQFTLHASGHNPRPTKKERYRQRIMHKYLYVRQNLGYIACTGCGRCIRSCPAGMNIKSVVKSIMEELT